MSRANQALVHRQLLLSPTLVLAMLNIGEFLPVGSLHGEYLAVDRETVKSVTLNRPEVVLRPAPSIEFPGGVDCNSPVHWDGDTMFMFNSDPNVVRSSGTKVLKLGGVISTHYNNQANGGRWIEATYKSEGGKLYGWYHNEPHPVCSAKSELTAPRIGAVVSTDNGANWQDLGIITLEHSPEAICYAVESRH